MKKKRVGLLCVIVLFIAFQIDAKKEEIIYSTEESMTKLVHKYELDNGMKVLVRSVHTLPKVSVQLFYNVGSKDEGTGERGIAHFIEHLIFKGTSGKKSLNLSESDINMLAQLFTADMNAFTSYDYTGYRFDVPTHNWQKVLPIMADCMQHCSFKDDHINSEMKAVIQELKMGKDNYVRNLMFEMAGAIFDDHPYHHPIIGYKQDLWSIDSEGLKSFYKKHYKPNNATLVVVGDVDPEHVKQEAQRVFGHIKADPNYQKQAFYHNKDIATKSVTLYRDINQPEVLLAYVIPGEHAKKDHIFDVINYLLFTGKSSRLHNKLVDEQQLVTSLSAGHLSFFDHGLFIVAFEPKDVADIDLIIKEINDEYAALAKEGIDTKELESATKKTRMRYYGILENIQKQAYDIGKVFLATGDEERALHCLEGPSEKLAQEIRTELTRCFRPSVTHKGFVLPLPEEEKEAWVELQHASDEEDSRILSARARTSPVEPPSYAKTVQPSEQGVFAYPKPETFVMNNNAKVLYHHNDTTPKINVVVDLKACDYYDPEDKQGIFGFVARMLSEGTEKYTAAELAGELESRGMSFAAYPGGLSISMLKEDLEKGLELLEEILNHSVFNEKVIEKVRTQLLADLKGFWDDPKLFSRQLIREHIYKNHPYAKNNLGTEESIKSITRDDLLDFYQKYIRPYGAHIAVVGDIADYDLKSIFERTLGKWQGPEVPSMEFPAIEPCPLKEFNYPINRDQVILAFAASSIDRKHPDYEKCVLFDQIFSGRSLMSLHSKLFQLREQSGLFYSIGGSVISQANEQPGMVQISTMVSRDRLEEAEKAIKQTVDTVLDTISEEELDQARTSVITAMMNNFESNYGIANTFLFLEKYGLGYDYFDTRNERLKAITLDDMKRAVQTILSKGPLTTFRVGRVEKLNNNIA